MSFRPFHLVFILPMLSACGFLAAQFSGPNASTYNPNTGKYYITNFYGKNVISLDANNNKATFISGLTSPNNIIYADLPVGSGFLILDSNEIKAYDDAGGYFATFGTTGALKLQDLVFDTASKALYTSDVDRGLIYKTTFGPAPFYFPITGIFSAPYRRPSAMVIQKNSNRILYVEDTIGGNLMAINLSNGNVSQVKSLNIDNLVGLAEDGQGNMYLSSQGTKAIYQLNKYYVGAPKKLYSEPKPGDLFVNVEKDQWVYTCLSCGTVFTPSIHIFGPGYEEDLCPGDSFPSYRNFLMNNIGTFDAGNQFIAELSNASGSFQNPTFIASFKDTLVPDSIACALPKFISQGNGYKLRWRSTKPAIIGTKENVFVNALPKISISVSDTVQGCLGSSIVLGENNPKTGISYQWEPSSFVDSPSRYSCLIQLDSQVKIFLTAINSAGCKSKDSALIFPVSLPNPGFLADTIHTCKGVSAQLGGNPKGGLSYSWSPGVLLNDSLTAQPLYTDTSNKTFTLTVTAPGGCKSTVGQSVVIHPLPTFRLVWDSIALCNPVTALNSIIHSYPKYKCIWIGPNKDTTVGDSRGFDWNYVGLTGYTKVVFTELAHGCSSAKKAIATILPRTDVALSYVNFELLPNVNLTNRKWFRNDSLIASDSATYAVKISGKYKLCGKDSNGCEVCTPENQYLSNTNAVWVLKNTPCILFPNPALDWFSVNCQAQDPEPWSIFDSQGRMVLKGTETQIDIHSLDPGIYIFTIQNHLPVQFVKTLL